MTEQEFVAAESCREEIKTYEGILEAIEGMGHIRIEGPDRVAVIGFKDTNAPFNEQIISNVKTLLAGLVNAAILHLKNEFQNDGFKLRGTDKYALPSLLEIPAQAVTDVAYDYRPLREELDSVPVRQRIGNQIFATTRYGPFVEFVLGSEYLAENLLQILKGQSVKFSESWDAVDKHFPAADTDGRFCVMLGESVEYKDIDKERDAYALASLLNECPRGKRETWEDFKDWVRKNRPCFYEDLLRI